MKSFYTLIKISTNPVSGDQTTIGILLKSDTKYYLKFSERKINTISRLIPGNDRLFRYFRKQLENQIQDANETLIRENRELFDYDTILSSEFFQHLNNVSQNLIRFTAPSIITTIDSKDKFDKLYNVLVDNLPEYEKAPRSEILIKNVEEKLINRVAGRVHTNIDINKKIIPSLNINLNLDAVGLNGSIVAAKSIDFNKESRTIETNLFRYKIVLAKLEEKYRRGRQAFVIADEPEAKNSENYNIWEILNSKEDFTLYNSEEANKVAEYIEENNAQKFLEFAE